MPADDLACWEGDEAAREFLGLLDAHAGKRETLEEAAEAAALPAAGLENYPGWREMSGRRTARLC